MQEKDLNPEIFKFEKSDINMYIFYDLKIREKFVKAFGYLIGKLGVNEYKDKLNLDKIKWSKGKNYDYLAIHQDNIHLLFRRYGSHFTIFYKHKHKISKYGDDYDDEYGSRYGVFTFETDTSHLSDKDRDNYYQNEAKDLNKHLSVIFDMIRDNKAHMFWNPLCLKLPKAKEREKHIKIKSVWTGGESITSIDLLIFAVEEMFQKYLEVFSETDMLEKIKTLKKGDKCGSNTVVKTHTKVKDGYFHDAGITWKTAHKEEEFRDVYCLTRYGYEEVFNIEEVEEKED
jgi:hypothetical protein